MGQQEIHEYEASGGGFRRRLHCRLTSFSRGLQINLRIILDSTPRLSAVSNISHTNCMTLVNMSGAWCRVPMVSRGPASPTCRVCSCCARSCLRAVSSPGMPYALPTTAMLWMQSSTSSLFPFFRSCAMASFANCSCSAFAFSIVILNPPSVFWALPVSTQWHIHLECLSSNTNKKACSNSTFCREQERAAFPKNPRKSGSKSLG